MSDEWAAIFLGAVSGGTVSYFYGVLTQSKSENPARFNKLLDELKSQTAAFNNFSIQYWGSDVFDAGTMLSIITIRSEIFATISRINSMQNGLFVPELLKNKYTLYTTSLTTSPFGSQNNHIKDPKRVMDAIESLEQCRSFIDSNYYKTNHWAFWNKGLK